MQNQHDIPANFWDIKVHTIDGEEKTLNHYKGPKLFLFINVASKCGLTRSNYEQLTPLYNDFKEKVSFLHSNCANELEN